MLQAGLEFEEDVSQVLTTMTALRPLYFSHEERIKNDADRVSGDKRLASFIEKSRSGFFLLGDAVTYAVRVAAGRPVVCDCFIDLETAAAVQLLTHVSTAAPRFGFACEPSEREHRNRIVTQLGINKVESWVGRDIERYVPAFYWLTLLTDALAERHGVSLSAVRAAALEHVDLGQGRQLFRFNERPQDWRTTSAVSELCGSLSGVFNMDRLRSGLNGARNVLELNSILRNYR